MDKKEKSEKNEIADDDLAKVSGGAAVMVDNTNMFYAGRPLKKKICPTCGKSVIIIDVLHGGEMVYNGESIQHVSLRCADCGASWDCILTDKDL